MWLEALCERHHDEIALLVSMPQRDEDALFGALQRICVQLTGRNCTRHEWDYLKQEGLIAFEVLLHGYMLERREALRPDRWRSILPPGGVVRAAAGQYRPVYASLEDAGEPIAVPLSRQP